VDKVRLIKKDKKKVEERLDLLNQRQELKQAFIRKKQAVRSEIGLLKTKAEGLGILKERDLKELQEEFREIDQEFRDMGVMADRDELFDGVRPREDDPSKMNNKQLLGKALDTQKDTHAKLKEGLDTLNSTVETAKTTAAVLAADQEKIHSINMGLDQVESELAISQKRLTMFVKRLYTDKVIIAFTFLIVMGIVGIIVYATLNPNQKIFNVPDNVIPPVTTPTPSPAASP